MTEQTRTERNKATRIRQRDTKRTKHLGNVTLFRGAIRLTTAQQTALEESQPLRTKARHACHRVETDGMVIVSRVGAPDVGYGEIVRTANGRLRVHLWDDTTIDGTLIADLAFCNPIVPPMFIPVPSWIE